MALISVQAAAGMDTVGHHRLNGRGGRCHITAGEFPEELFQSQTCCQKVTLPFLSHLDPAFMLRHGQGRCSKGRDGPAIND